MKAITLTQPWATLVAIGAKTIETRSWGTKHRGPLAIHAAAGLGPVGGTRGLIETIEREPFKSVLRLHVSGYTPEERAADLPRGGIVAIASLTEVVAIGRAVFALKVVGIDFEERVRQEVSFGDYSQGRYAWLFERTLNVHDPVECRGALGLWTVPEPVRQELARIDDRAAAIQL